MRGWDSHAGVQARASRSRLVVWLILCLTLLLFVGAGGRLAYDRSLYGGWLDQDGNCRDTRQEVLVRDSRKPVLWRQDSRAERHCEVAWGEWQDPWSGEVLNDPEKVDIDHTVPLEQVHESGGATWTAKKRRAYATDLQYRGHLRATSAATNRSKGSRGPESWRPPNPETHCAYALAWSAIKTTWGLRTTAAERAALRQMLQTCP